MSTFGIEIRLRSDVPSAASIFAIMSCSDRGSPLSLLFRLAGVEPTGRTDPVSG